MMDNNSILTFDPPHLDVLVDDTINFTSKVAGTPRMYMGLEDKSEEEYVILKKLDKYFTRDKRDKLIQDEILPQMPEGIWGSNEFIILENFWIKKLNDMRIYDQLQKEVEKRGFQDVSFEVLRKISFMTKEYSDAWKKATMNENDFKRIQVLNEVYHTLCKINEVSRKWTLHLIAKKRHIEKVMKDLYFIYGRISLLLIRISEISYHLQNGEIDKAKEKSEYLRTERYEIEFYEFHS